MRDLVLFLDDEQYILKSYQRALANMPYKVLTADNHEQAMQTINNNSERLLAVISDIMMPDINGIKFLKIVTDCYPLINTMIITGQADLDTALRSINEIAVKGYLMKPVSTEVLNEKIMTLYNEEQNSRRACGDFVFKLPPEEEISFENIHKD